MIHPTLYEDGTNNWAEVDWDDPDIGTYTNLCPDKRRAEFEYGSLCIANIARKSHMFRQTLKAPSKVERDLEKLDKALAGVPIQASVSLNVAAGLDRPFDGAVDRMRRIVHRAIGGVKRGGNNIDHERATLGRDASAIWVAHGGDVNDDYFVDFVEFLIKDAGFVKLGGKSRIDDKALVEEVRKDVAERGAPPWQLW